MAEIAGVAGGALVAEQVVSTAVEGGTAGYLVSQPTLPLKATYNRIATAKDDETRRSLARSQHTLTVVDNKAYIFGGVTAKAMLSSNDIHVVTLAHDGDKDMDYSLIPAVPSAEGAKVPASRAKHAACAFHGSVAIFGGCDVNGQLLDEGSSIWLFNPEKAVWDNLKPANFDSAPGSRSNSRLFAQDDFLILYGGVDGSGSTASDLWRFDIQAQTWTQLPTAPVSTSNATLSSGQLYLISSSDSMSSQLHHLEVKPSHEADTWETFDFPTNPIAPGPRARHNGALLPVTTGFGRNYLVYFLGMKEDPMSPGLSDLASDDTHPKEALQWSDMWTLQLPSSDVEAKPKMDVKEALKPAKIKDAIRSALGADSGKWAWAEAEVQVPNTLPTEEGKLHPGPRAFFGADVMKDKRSVVFWGGEDAKGDSVGDGWIVKLE